MRSWSGLFYWFASNPNMNLKFVYKFWEENVLAMILPVLTFWYFYLFHFYPPPKKEAIQQTKTRTNSTVVEKLHNSLKSSPKCIGNSAEFMARATSYAYLIKDGGLSFYSPVLYLSSVLRICFITSCYCFFPNRKKCIFSHHSSK